MERADSSLFRTVSISPVHDYEALSHEQSDELRHISEERLSQEEPNPRNHLLEYDEASETATGDTSAHDQTDQDRRQVTGKPEAKNTPSARLHRSGYILILVFIYIGLMVSSWVITCYLSFRPITANHYGSWIWNNDNNGYGWSSAEYIISLYRKNEQWYRAARVIQSIASVLTIPLTSAVCSSAAVIFIQKRTRGLSMRQVITIADKGWTDIPKYSRIFPFFGSKNGWKRYGSSFLLLAIFVNLLGLIISPLQEYFVFTTTIKTPTYPFAVMWLLDIPDQFSMFTNDPDYTDDNFVVLLTRNALASASDYQPQSQLW